MDKRLTQRKSGQVIAAAIASVGLAGWGASQADAGLVIDVRATGVTAGSTINSGGKGVLVAAGTVTVTMGVFARLSGTNATQQVGEFGGGNGADTRNDDFLQIVGGGFNSVGGLLGNMSNSVGATAFAGVQPAYNTRTIPFSQGAGGNNGVLQDWDSDGDLDIGNGGTTDPTTLWTARSSNAASATLTDGVNKGVSSGPDGAASFTANNNDTIIDATTQELQIGSIRFITTGSGTGTTAVVNFIARPGTDGGVGNWFQDGSNTASTPGTSPFSVNAGVSVTAVPEPATLGLLGIASLGLLARRRNNNA